MGNASNYSNNFITKIVPVALFKFCDVYLLILFIILIFFYIGTDFKNSMEEISLAIGGCKSNKFMFRKLISLLVVYTVLYLISFTNIYTLYISKVGGMGNLISIKEIILYSLVTNVFIISLSLFIIYISRDIAVSTSIITSYYLIEEALWRCKITQTKGILGHIYQYSDYGKGEILKVKLFYVFISIILLIFTYKISERKKFVLDLFQNKG
ncbi:hypothetical protein [Candidatus Clostridium radicumherbarum]|uniref:ABC transporter permease n=1 Tax=Candidatus Clostridium radicumherbarum TaxID=3381662 RepID=A0ABW8TNN5_9CLOT